MKNNNVDIFICTHKDFDNCPKSPEYKIISKNLLSGFYNLGVVYEGDDFFSNYQKMLNEFTYINYVYENYPLKDYVGFCHYRRYFHFYDKIPNMDNMFRKYDIIITEPKIYNLPLTDPLIQSFLKIKEKLKLSVRDQFSFWHNVEDLDLVDDVISLLHGKDSWMLKKWKEYKAQYIFYGCNMFIMKSNDFRKYMSWLIPIVRLYISKTGIKKFDDAINWVKKNEKKYDKTNTPNVENFYEYQARFIGLVVERLTSFYIWLYFKNPKIYKIKDFSLQGK